MNENTISKKEELIFWAVSNKNRLYWALLAAIFCIALILKLFLGGKQKDLPVYTAKSFFLKWKSGTDEAAFAKLADLLKRHPKLQREFEPQIAQEWINKESHELAAPYAISALSNLSSLAAYEQFSKITLLISQKTHEEALEQSLKLKEDLLQRDARLSDCALLFGFNLLRIAFLCQALDDKEGEMAAWSEVKNYLALGPKSPNQRVLPERIVTELVNHFSEEGLALHEYLKHRERLLKK